MRKYDEVIEFLQDEIKERMHLKSRLESRGQFEDAFSVNNDIMCLRMVLSKYKYLNKKEM